VTNSAVQGVYNGAVMATASGSTDV